MNSPCQPQTKQEALRLALSESHSGHSFKLATASFGGNAGFITLLTVAFIVLFPSLRNAAPCSASAKTNASTQFVTPAPLTRFAEWAERQVPVGVAPTRRRCRPDQVVENKAAIPSTALSSVSIEL